MNRRHCSFPLSASGCSAVGSARGLGPWGRRFESCHSDHLFKEIRCSYDDGRLDCILSFKTRCIHRPSVRSRFYNSKSRKAYFHAVFSVARARNVYLELRRRFWSVLSASIPEYCCSRLALSPCTTTLFQHIPLKRRTHRCSCGGNGRFKLPHSGRQTAEIYTRKIKSFGGIAQLVRAHGSHPWGRGLDRKSVV